jgi:hypothetical protein
MANYLTYENISDQICAAMGDFQKARIAEVQAVINMVYLNEVMVCDDQYPLFWLMELVDGVKTKVSKTITGVTKANPGVVTAAAHGFVNGDIVHHGVITGMPELSYQMAVVTNKDANTYELYDLGGNKIDTSGYTAVGTAGKVYHRGVTLSKNISKVHTMSWQTYNGLVPPLGLEGIEKDASLMDVNNSSRPTKHFHKQHFTTAGVKSDRLLWYPLPDGVYDGRVWGDLDVSPMSGNSDVPQLPFKFHNAIVAGSIARLTQYGQVQIENAVIWPGLYKIHLEAIKTYNRNYWKQFDSLKRSDLYLL